MAVRKIVKYGQSILRQKTNPVTEFDDEIRHLAEDMVETMQEAEGIGLAAPQVGESKALCVVNLELIDETAEPKAYINPKIVADDGTSTLEEGCLSIPDIREDITRPESITVKYQDINGEKHEEQCFGMLARVLQHEIDHLNGILFIDRISPMRRKLLSKKLKKIASESSFEAPISASG